MDEFFKDVTSLRQKNDASRPPMFFLRIPMIFLKKERIWSYRPVSVTVILAFGFSCVYSKECNYTSESFLNKEKETK